MASRHLVSEGMRGAILLAAGVGAHGQKMRCNMTQGIDHVNTSTAFTVHTCQSILSLLCVVLSGGCWNCSQRVFESVYHHHSTQVHMESDAVPSCKAGGNIVKVMHDGRQEEMLDSFQFPYACALEREKETELLFRLMLVSSHAWPIDGCLNTDSGRHW